MTFKKILGDPDFKDTRRTLKPEDFPEAVYKCPPCKDLGWVEGTYPKSAAFPSGVYTYLSICKCERRRRAAIAVAMLEHQHKIFKGLGFDTYHPENESQREAVAICRGFIAGWPSLRVPPEDPHKGRGGAEKCPPAQDLAAKRPIPEHQGLLFYGPVGTGKTSLLLSTAKALAEKDCTIVEWWRATQLAARLRAPMQPDARESEEAIMRELGQCELFFLDDLGAENASSYIQGCFFEILDERHIQRRATFITTNLEVNDYELETRLGQRMFSRLNDMCRFHKIEGRDRRRK